MRDGVRVEIEGLKELQIEIWNLRDVQLRRQLRETNLRAADLVARGALFYAPQDTGTLMGTIRAVAGQTWAEVRAGGARAPYAAAIHWGWPAHNIAAQKFIYRSADESYDDVKRTYETDFDHLMDLIRSF